MFRYFRRINNTLIIIIGLSVFSIIQEGCSSVSIIAQQASKADDIVKKTEVALWWGLSDPVENVDCRSNGLQFVGVKSNWLYSLCTVITLGAVIPMDVEYRCTSEQMLDGGTIGMRGK